MDDRPPENKKITLHFQILQLLGKVNAHRVDKTLARKLLCGGRENFKRER
jgi:hypothetical protein